MVKKCRKCLRRPPDPPSDIPKCQQNPNKQMHLGHVSVDTNRTRPHLGHLGHLGSYQHHRWEVTHFIESGEKIGTWLKGSLGATQRFRLSLFESVPVSSLKGFSVIMRRVLGLQYHERPLGKLTQSRALTISFPH